MMFTVVREMYQGVKVDVFLAHTNYPAETPCLEWQGTYDRGRHPFFEAKSLFKWEKPKRRCAIRLCAGFFGVEIPEGTRIRMRCGNPRCVDPAHLGDSKTVPKFRAARGEKNGNAKFTDDQVSLIRARFAAGEKQADLA